MAFPGRSPCSNGRSACDSLETDRGLCVSAGILISGVRYASAAGTTASEHASQHVLSRMRASVRHLGAHEAGERNYACTHVPAAEQQNTYEDILTIA